MTYDLMSEASGDVYRSLLDFGLTQCSQALLVTSPGELPMHVATVLNTLSPHLITSEERGDWPGTTLLSGGARVWTYHYDPEVASVLRDATSGLYGWQE